MLLPGLVSKRSKMVTSDMHRPDDHAASKDTPLLSSGLIRTVANAKHSTFLAVYLGHH